ncbi:PAN domain-containing protein [Bradyrhizobium sp. 2TAF24]|uniref:PAN domain-containing protein n=1 Tax=Bradyrhizobium sp. 2TAF24 TaxID=3233011 RepID=UPI003F900E8E
MVRARRLRACLAAVAAFAALIVAMPQSLLAQTNFDRPGGDYMHSPVPSGDPADCALQCERDRRCRAWSFNYPTYAAAEAVCWLKSSVPPRVANNCCVSGVRGAGVLEQRTGAVEMSTDRFGGDYRSFELKGSEHDDACKEACEADNKCRAWTYARPGYIGKDARCFLKSQIKPPHRKPGFVSGVVR